MRRMAFIVIDAVGYGMEYLRSRCSGGLCFTTEAVLILIYKFNFILKIDIDSFLLVFVNLIHEYLSPMVSH